MIYGPNSTAVQFIIDRILTLTDDERVRRTQSRPQPGA